MDYKESIKRCSDLYRKTYGTKTVEEMTEKGNKFRKYQFDVAAKFNVSIEKVKKDTNTDYTARYYDK